jgi:hypothetical protein
MVKREIPKREFDEITQAVSLFPKNVSRDKLLEVLTEDAISLDRWRR